MPVYATTLILHWLVHKIWDFPRSVLTLKPSLSNDFVGSPLPPFTGLFLRNSFMKGIVLAGDLELDFIQ